MKLYHQRKKALSALCKQLISDRKTKGMCSVVRRVHVSVFYGKKLTLGSTWLYPKDEDSYQKKTLKPASVVVHQGHWHGWFAWLLWKCIVPSMHWIPLNWNFGEKYVTLQHLFLTSLWLFQRNNARPQSAQLRTACLKKHSVCLTACSPDLLIKMYGALWGKSENDHQATENLVFKPYCF